MAGQDSFTPDSFTPDVEAPKKDSFQPDSFVPDTQAKDSFTPDSFTPDKADKGTNAGWIVPGQVSQEEIQKIAAKHPGVKPEDLTDWVNYYGGIHTNTSLSDVAKAAAGSAAESVAIGIPQFLAKKTQDETHQKALDELSDLVSEKKSTLQKVAELGGSIAGSIGLAGKIGKLAPSLEGAYQGVAALGGGTTAGLTHSKTGEEAQGAAQGAAIGAVGLGIGALGEKLMKTGREATEKFGLTGEKTLDEVISNKLAAEEPKMEVVKKALAGQALDSADKQKLLGVDYEYLTKQANPSEAINSEVTRRIDNVKKGIAKRLTGNESVDSFEEAARDLAGTGKVEKAYEDNVQDQLLSSVAKEGGQVRPLTKLEGMAQVFSDVKPLNEITDKRYGSKLSRTMDESSNRIKQIETAYDPLKQEGAALHRSSTPDLDKQIVKDIESGNLESPEAQKWAGIFTQMRDTANRLGLGIRERANYVPSVRLDLPEYKQAIVSRLETKGPEDPELLTELTRWNGGKAPLPSEVDGLVGQIKSSGQGEFQSKVAGQASVTKARDDMLPDWLRETNLAKLQDKWIGQIQKQYALEPHLDEMAKVAKVADYKGDTVTAERLRNHMDDLLGNRQDWPTEVLNQEKQFLGDMQDRIDQATGLNKKVLQARVAAPRLASQLTGTMYANLLSSPKAAMQNLASPVLGAFSELGHNYGTKLYLESMMDAVKAVRDGAEIVVKPHMADILGAEAGQTVKIRNLKQIAQNEGLLGVEMKGAVPHDYQPHKVTSVVNAINNGSLAMFQVTDDLSKSVVAFMGKRLSNDLIKNPESVTDLIKSPSYRNYISGLIKAGDNEKVESTVKKYLMGHTLLNFDKIGMSEYGRVVGPMLRSFTKYPSYYFGRAMQPAYEKGLVSGGAELAGMYGAPLATFMLLDKAMDSKESPTIKALTTADGLTGWTPAASTMPVFQNNFGLAKTPIVGLGTSAWNAGKSLMRDETDASEVFSKYLQQTASTLAPGMGILKLVGEDLPAVKGQEPDRTLPPIQRRFEGAKSIFD